MKTSSPLHFYLRIALVSVLIAVLGLGPTLHTADTLLSNAYQFVNSRDFLNAARSMADAAQYYPSRANLYLMAAHYASQAGNPQLTIQNLECPTIYPSLSIDDLILLGDAYHQLGDESKAVSIWKQVLGQGDSTQVYQRLAHLSLQQKDYVSALNYSQKLLQINPSDISLYYQIGLLYAAVDPEKALPLFAQSIQLDSTSASQAKTLYDKIRTADLSGDSAYVLLASGRQLANMGEWELAAEAFKNAVNLMPGYADALAFLGEAQQQISHQQTGYLSDAGLSDLELAMQSDAKSILANTFMGLYWERHQDYTQAEHYLKEATTLEPFDPYLYSELANVFSKAGDLPDAQSTYESAIQLSPQDPTFYRLLAEFALDNQIQIRELALPAARQAIILNPDDSSSLDVMAQVMLMLQDYHSAERFSLKAIQYEPDFAPAYLHLGTAYLHLGEPDLAHQWLSSAKDINPDSWVSAQAARMLEYYFP